MTIGSNVDISVSPVIAFNKDIREGLQRGPFFIMLIPDLFLHNIARKAFYACILHNIGVIVVS